MTFQGESADVGTKKSPTILGLERHGIILSLLYSHANLSRFSGLHKSHLESFWCACGLPASPTIIVIVSDKIVFEGRVVIMWTEIVVEIQRRIATLSQQAVNVHFDT